MNHPSAKSELFRGQVFFTGNLAFFILPKGSTTMPLFLSFYWIKLPRNTLPG